MWSSINIILNLYNNFIILYWSQCWSFKYEFKFEIRVSVVWHNMGIRYMGVGECQSEDPFVCFGARPTQSACVWDLLRNWKKTREGRSQSRTEKLTEQGSRQESAVNRSRENPTARTCGHRGCISQHESISQHFKYMLAVVHRCTESYTKVLQISPFLRLELTQVCDCLFFLVV